MPRGVAQERFENDRACDIVSYAYDTILRRYEISAYYYYCTYRHLQQTLSELHLLFGDETWHENSVNYWINRFKVFLDDSSKYCKIFVGMLINVFVVALTAKKASRA